MDKIVSFIIPSYNAGKYLKTALESFLLEEVLGKIEVIVVDDGSEDQTAEIAREYAGRMPGVFSLLQKENGGHGSAINEGTRIAAGKYLKVIDADDWVVTGNLPQIIEALEACEADVVLTPFHMVDMETGKREIRCMYLEDYEKTYTLKDVVGNWKSFDRCMTFHGMMYKREFYEGCRHELPEKIFYEDQEYASIPCCHAGTIQAMDLFLYQYLVGNADQSVASRNQLKRISHIRQVALNLLRYRVGNKGLSSSGRGYLLKKAEGTILSYYTIANLANPDKREGRAWSRALNRELEALDPEFFAGIKKKYYVYSVLNRLGMGMDGYEKLLNSGIYNFLRGNHRRERE